MSAPFSAHFLKTIALLIVWPVSLQACFVGTSLPLAHGDKAGVEKQKGNAREVSPEL